jgi:hypothetical protein
MTKYSPGKGALPEVNDLDLEDAEINITGLLQGALAFPGAQYFNEIMHEKMRPKKVAKFRVSRKLESNF